MHPNIPRLFLKMVNIILWRRSFYSYMTGLTTSPDLRIWLLVKLISLSVNFFCVLISTKKGTQHISVHNYKVHEFAIWLWCLLFYCLILFSQKHVLLCLVILFCSLVIVAVYLSYLSLKSASVVQWFSGRVLACHADGPGSFPCRSRALPTRTEPAWKGRVKTSM